MFKEVKYDRISFEEKGQLLRDELQKLKTE